MSTLIKLVLALSILAISDGISLQGKSRRNERIHDGQLAAPGAFPYIVSLRDVDNKHFCAGSIIGSRTVLTTAYCVYRRNPMSIFIVAGSNQLNSGGTNYSIANINIPSFYIDNIMYPGNDISLVYTTIPFEINAFVQSILCGSNEIGQYVTGRFAGWGRITSMGVTENELRTIERVTMDIGYCYYIYNSITYLFDTNLCTEYGRLCDGDRGGPLVVNGNIVAIFSWGIGCGYELPDVYTRISSFKSWISSNAI